MKIGSGQLALLGPASYGGNTTVTAGTLLFGNSAGMTAGGNVQISGPGQLQISGNYAQSAGNFSLSGGGNFQTNGTFNLSTSGLFQISDSSSFQIGNLAASSLTVGAMSILNGTQVTLPRLTATGNVTIDPSGVHIAGDGAFTGPTVSISDSGSYLIVDGSLTLGNGTANTPTALIAGNGTYMTVGSTLNLLSGSSVDLSGGGVATIGSGRCPRPSVPCGSVRAAC